MDSRAQSLTLRFDGVRHRGGVFAATVTFDAAAIARAFDPRNPGTTPALAAGLRVVSQIAQPGQTTLHMARELGPGEGDEFHFVIAYGNVNCDLQFKAGCTVRSWPGFYPLARDLRRSGRAGMAALLGALGAGGQSPARGGDWLAAACAQSWSSRRSRARRRRSERRSGAVRQLAKVARSSAPTGSSPSVSACSGESQS
jgi:hypothetical protein